MLLSLNGNIEEVIFAMGFQAVELGNTSLKPNFYFKHIDPDEFDHLRLCVDHMKKFVLSVKKQETKEVEISDE